MGEDALGPGGNFGVVRLHEIHQRLLDVVAEFATLARLAIDVFTTLDLLREGRGADGAGVVAALQKFLEELFVKIDVVVKLGFPSLSKPSTLTVSSLFSSSEAFSEDFSPSRAGATRLGGCDFSMRRVGARMVDDTC